MPLFPLIFLLSSTAVLALTPPDGDNISVNRTCGVIFEDNGMNYTTFSLGAAHGLHSLSLEEIRHFFEAEAPEINKIPVINTDFRSEQSLLFNAPLWGYSDRFSSWSLKIMDFLMLNDKPYFLEQGTNTLEKIVHQYHMHEIYELATIIYQELKSDPPVDPDFCPCVNDVTANGILEDLARFAKNMKYFARQPRARQTTERWTAEGWGARQLQKREAEDANNDDNGESLIAQREQEYLDNANTETALNLLKVSPWVPGTFAGPDQWLSRSASVTYAMITEEQIRDFATFIFCKLNQPEFDHPRDLF
eukprot:TRINITY_DN2034_c0_g1_i7.p1 TRINITY_DN2034_c0_g1~~TRINITY_DN2034_c0_g1_i7.p1  ORF type:complete len:306 (-),score=61.42 TRINITY_DN2034_c0_g1_i7:125-1042(-)